MLGRTFAAPARVAAGRGFATEKEIAMRIASTKNIQKITSFFFTKSASKKHLKKKKSDSFHTRGGPNYFELRRVRESIVCVCCERIACV